MITAINAEPAARGRKQFSDVAAILRLVAGAVLLGGCSFPPLPPLDNGTDSGTDDADGSGLDGPETDGTPASDGGIDGPIDAPPGAWSALSPLPMNTALYTETTPALSPDGLTLYFVGVRNDKIQSLDVNYSRRMTTSSAFASGQSTEFSIDTAGADEIQPFVSHDYKELYFVRNGNILVSRRSALIETWPGPTDTLIDGAHPMLTENGLTLYYYDASATCPVQTCRSKRTRESLTANWGPAVVESFPPGQYQYVHVSNDGRRVLLSDTLSPSSYSVAIAYRDTPTSPWGSPVPITSLGVGSRIRAARWSWDESELFVAFEENGGLHNLYVSRRQ